MTSTYKGYTISKLTRKGVYQVTDSNGQLVITLPLLRHAKRFIDRRAERLAIEQVLEYIVDDRLAVSA